jgi:hypothetical protein
MFAYLGLGPGQEFIPYFLALLAFIWAAVIAVVQWPFFALLRLIRGGRQPAPEPSPAQSASSNVIETPDTPLPPVPAGAQRST